MPELPEPTPNPFDEWSDEELYQGQVALTYGCLRSKAAINKYHHKYICALQQVLDCQASARASQKPHFPFQPPACPPAS